jgi:hypothetical protein
MRWGLIASLAVAIASPVAGAPSPLMSPGDAVPDHPGMDYIALVRLAISDLALNPDDHQIEGHLSAPPPRRLAGDAPDAPASSDPIALGNVQDKRILVGGHRRIALLADVGDGQALLILYDDEGSAPKVLDQAEVDLDRYTAFVDDARLTLGPGDEALATYSEHDDADLTMGHYLLISTVDDRLQMIDRFDVNSVRMCGWNGVQSARFDTRPDAGRRFRRIDLAVTYVVTRIAEECGDKRPKSHKQMFSASYRWDAAGRRFVTSSDALKRLAALNGS